MSEKKATYYTTQSSIAVKPLLNKGIETKIKGGVAIMDHVGSTVETVLVYDALINNEILPKGSLIVFSGEAVSRPWNTRVLKHRDSEFVMAPYSEVLLVGSAE